MKKLFDFIWVLFHPNFWIMNYSYDDNWDKKLKFLLNNYSFKNIEKCTAHLGKEILWIGNYPYAAFIKYGVRGGFLSGRASRKAIYKARQKLMEDIVSSNKQIKQTQINVLHIH